MSIPMFGRIIKPPSPFQNTLGEIFFRDFDIELNDIKLVGGLGTFLQHIAKDHGAGEQAVVDFPVIPEFNPF